MSKKFLISLAPLLAVAAFALVPSAALAVVSKPCLTNVLCSGNEGKEPLRDDFAEPPASTTGSFGTVKGGFGTSALAVNTAGPLRLLAKLGTVTVANKNPAGYAFFGVKLDKNSVTSTTKCETATGYVTFVDIQDATTLNEKGEEVSSPVYSGEGPFSPTLPTGARGGLGPWLLKINSDNTGCSEAERGKVTISNVSLYFPTLSGLVATGQFVGQYVQPTGGTVAPCPAGGVELAISQPGISLTLGTTPELDNGTTGKKAFICFVSSNNYLFPKTAPTWAPFSDFTKSEKPGIWKD